MNVLFESLSPVKLNSFVRLDILVNPFFNLGCKTDIPCELVLLLLTYLYYYIISLTHLEFTVHLNKIWVSVFV